MESDIDARMVSIRGASKHALWTGKLYFVNVGLAGEALQEKQWSSQDQRCMRRLVEHLFVEHAADEAAAVASEPGVAFTNLCGILFSAVGNRTDSLNALDQVRFNNVIETTWLSNTSDCPTLYWSRDETMAAFSPQERLEHLDPLKYMSNCDAWWTVERFVLLGASMYDSVAGFHNEWLVYHTQQPDRHTTSGRPRRSFSQPQRVAACKAVLKDAIQYCVSNPRCVGFVLGGDANCSIPIWCYARSDMENYSMLFQEPHFVTSRSGDIIVVGVVIGARMEIFENSCRVEGLQPDLHNPMMFKWEYFGPDRSKRRGECMWNLQQRYMKTRPRRCSSPGLSEAPTRSYGVSRTPPGPSSGCDRDKTVPAPCTPPGPPPGYYRLPPPLQVPAPLIPPVKRLRCLEPEQRVSALLETRVDGQVVPGGANSVLLGGDNSASGTLLGPPPAHYPDRTVPAPCTPPGPPPGYHPDNIVSAPPVERLRLPESEPAATVSSEMTPGENAGKGYDLAPDESVYEVCRQPHEEEATALYMAIGYSALLLPAFKTASPSFRDAHLEYMTSVCSKNGVEAY